MVHRMPMDTKAIQPTDIIVLYPRQPKQSSLIHRRITRRIHRESTQIVKKKCSDLSANICRVLVWSNESSIRIDLLVIVLYVRFFSKTVDILIHESGCVLEHEQASNFRELIMSGKWSDALVALEKLKQYIEERDGIQVNRFE
mgnify:CR=1 FL=1